MTLQDWLSHCERLHPQTIQLGLERVAQVAARMDLRFDCPVITVADANGKGSTCAMLESIFREAGYRNLWTPYAELYHHESLSRGHEDSPEKIQRFQSETHHMKEKWGDKLLWDPYYNENLTRDREDFSLL